MLKDCIKSIVAILITAGLVLPYPINAEETKYNEGNTAESNNDSSNPDNYEEDHQQSSLKENNILETVEKDVSSTELELVDDTQPLDDNKNYAEIDESSGIIEDINIYGEANTDSEVVDESKNSEETEKNPDIAENKNAAKTNENSEIIEESESSKESYEDSEEINLSEQTDEESLNEDPNLKWFEENGTNYRKTKTYYAQISLSEVESSLNNLISQRNGTKWVDNSYGLGSQCYEFAHYVFNTITRRGAVMVGRYDAPYEYKFNNLASDVWTVAQVLPGCSSSDMSSFLSKLQAGDYIQLKRRTGRQGAHSMIVVSATNSEITFCTNPKEEDAQS